MNATKKTLGAVLALTVLVLGATGAWAIDPDSTNNLAKIKVRITPNADYGVQIDTTNVQGTDSGIIDLGALSLAASTWTVRPATVTILGTVSARGGNGGQELDMVVDLAGTAWLIDPTPATDGIGATTDELSGFVLFSGTGLSVAPSGTDFGNATANAGITADAESYHVGGNSGAGTRFENQTGGGVDMDQLSATNARHMWMYFRLPPTTSTGAAQELTLTLTAGANL